MRRITRALVFSPLLFSLCLVSQAWGQQDVVISGTNQYTILGRSLSWASGVSNNFIFSAVNPNTQVCLYVTNNNPSSPHQFNVQLWQAGDPQVKSFQNNRSKWGAAQTVAIMPLTVNANTTVGVYFNVSAAAQMTAQFTNTFAAGGSPDTADLFAVQTTSGSCGFAAGIPIPVQGAYPPNTTLTPSNQFPVLIGGIKFPNSGAPLTEVFHVGAFGQGFALDANAGANFAFRMTPPTASTPQVMTPGCVYQNQESVCVMVSQVATPWGTPSGGYKYYNGFMRTNFLETVTSQGDNGPTTTAAWALFGKITNPGAGATILHFYTDTGAVMTYQLKFLTLSCSAACELQVMRTSSAGTTCTALTSRNLNYYGGTRQAPDTHSHGENSCTGAPTASDVFYDLSLDTHPETLDLTGFLNTANGAFTNGIAVINVAGITGFATATLTYAESQ